MLFIGERMSLVKNNDIDESMSLVYEEYVSGVDDDDMMLKRHINNEKEKDAGLGV